MDGSQVLKKIYFLSSPLKTKVEKTLWERQINTYFSTKDFLEDFRKKYKTAQQEALQKKEQAATDRKAVSLSPEIQKHLEGILATTGGGGKNKYGHLINRPSGFIDGLLEQKKKPDEIVAEWSKQHPDKKPITHRRVAEQAKHLLDEHGVTVEVGKSQAAKTKKA